MAARLKFLDDTHPAIVHQVLKMNVMGSPLKNKPCACCLDRRSWELQAYRWDQKAKPGSAEESVSMTWGACWLHLSRVLNHINRNINNRVNVTAQF